MILKAETKEEELKEWLEKRREERAEAKRLKEVRYVWYFTLSCFGTSHGIAMNYILLYFDGSDFIMFWYYD